MANYHFTKASPQSHDETRLQILPHSWKYTIDVFPIAKKASFEDKYDQIKELQSCVSCHNKISNHSGLKETFLKTWNSFQDDSGSLMAPFYNKVLPRVVCY